MADFVAVLRKTIGNLGENTPEMREKVYEKARGTISAKLAALNPQPPQAVVDRQLQALEDAIKVVRAEYEPEAAADDDGLEDIFSSMVDADPEPAPGKVPDELPASTHQDAVAAPVVAPVAANRYGEDPRFPVHGDATVPDGDGPAIDNDAPASKPRAERRDTAPMATPVRSGKRGGSRTGLIAALLAFVVIAGAGYAVWINRDDFASMFGGAATVETASEPGDLEQDVPPPDEVASAEPSGDDVEAPIDNPPAEAAPGPEGPEPKFTQRLLPDGNEIDDGPAGGVAQIGEGSSIASAAQNGAGGEQAPAATPGAQDPAAEENDAVGPIAVGQRAIFYEERTSTAQGSAETGAIVWSLVRESPGGDLPPEPAIRAEATIPESDLQLRMTIRRNGDDTLPASHIIEMIFLTPEGFGGGGINSVTRIAFKETEQAPGNPLMGIPARIADGFFLVALSDTPAEAEANLALMRRQSWIDIPLVYQSGRRALITLEKGTPGDRVFDEALRAWAQNPTGADNADADDAG